MLRLTSLGLALLLAACGDSAPPTVDADATAAPEDVPVAEPEVVGDDTVDADTSEPAETAEEVVDDPPADLCSQVELGPNAALGAARLFPSDSYWNTPVTDWPVDPASDAILATIGLDMGLHPDFGCCWNGGPFGIPYVVIDSDEVDDVPITFTYDSESDPGPYPIPPDAPIEGGPDATGDRHVLVLDCRTERLYEVFDAHPDGAGGWTGASGAVWDLNEEAVRAIYCTSADAAGLPLVPGLARYDEAATGEITHALRFTVEQSRRAFLRPPASHWASSSDDPTLPPMGMRVRLVPDDVLAADGVDVGGFDPIVRTLVTALQTYGMIVADNGGDWFVSGAPDARWDDETLVGQLGQIRGRHFEVLQLDGLVDDYDQPPGWCQL